MPTGERTLIVGQINMEHPEAHRVVNGRLVVNQGYLNGGALMMVILRYRQLDEERVSTKTIHDPPNGWVVSFKWWEPGDTPREPPQLRRIK